MSSEKCIPGLGQGVMQLVSLCSVQIDLGDDESSAKTFAVG
ncbi:MAG: hypothetical protein AAFY72_04060 [Cyanobacteria bacterium J06649_4]